MIKANVDVKHKYCSKASIFDQIRLKVSNSNQNPLNSPVSMQKGGQ